MGASYCWNIAPRGNRLTALEPCSALSRGKEAGEHQTGKATKGSPATVLGSKNVAVGSATIVQQCLEAGLLDEIHIDLVPFLFGHGIRLFDPVAEKPIELETIQVIEGTGVTHLHFRVVK